MLFFAIFGAALDVMKENAEQGTQEGSGAKFSIMQDEDGLFVSIDTDQHLFEGKDSIQMRKIAKGIIKARFRGKVLLVGESGKAYVDKHAEGEYTFPANRRLKENVKKTKYRASPELDNLLHVSKFLRHEPDDGSHPEVTRGWDIYKTMFMVDGIMFEGKVKIKGTDRGYLFHDITKIVEITRKYGQAIRMAAISNDLDTDSISQPDQNVKQTAAEIKEQVRHSLGIDAVSEAEKSLIARNTELEQVTRDLEYQLKDLIRQLGASAPSFFYLTGIENRHIIIP